MHTVYRLCKLVSATTQKVALRHAAKVEVQQVNPLFPNVLRCYSATATFVGRHSVTQCCQSREASVRTIKRKTPMDLECYATDARGNRPWYDLDYDELISMLRSKEIRVIDVRRRDETSSTGMMPGAINVPLDEMEKALQMDPDAFAKLYGGRKPQQSDTDIVFSCLGGVRSRRALEAAHKAGYDRARHFIGGWEEYSKRRS